MIPRRAMLRMPASCLVLLLLAIGAAAAEPAAGRNTGPWNIEALGRVPPATWGEWSGRVRPVYYEGEPLAGKPTRVFACYARPEKVEGRLPAMVLVHGGGGKAFAEWAELWARRGYAALAMDLAGCGPDGKRLPNGGPPQDDNAKFRDFTDDEVRQMWTYHAVAAAIRGHSLLASLPEVDPRRIGITGISWGGYLTCIIAGVDGRLKVAVPVYGCGFLHENSVWLGRLDQMKPQQRQRWVRHFDPSQYLPGVRCPILFTNGTNDFAYPLDSYRKSYRLVPGRVDLRIEVRMPHGHPQGWAPQEIGLYVDSVLTGGDPLPRLEAMKTTGKEPGKESGKRTASALFSAKVPVVRGQIHWTHDTGPWQDRHWSSADARIGRDTVEAELPAKRPIVYYLSVTDRRGAMVSTEHADLP